MYMELAVRVSQHGFRDPWTRREARAENTTTCSLVISWPNIRSAIKQRLIELGGAQRWCVQSKIRRARHECDWTKSCNCENNCKRKAVDTNPLKELRGEP